MLYHNLHNQCNIDYFQNQCIKVRFTPTEVDTVLYDINHGIGHAKKILVRS